MFARQVLTLALFLAGMAAVASAIEPPAALPAKPAEPAPKDPPANEPRIKTYAPGVRINWSGPSVEVDAVVALQQGQLELLACSPQTREHESILAIASRPRHIFEAMGLIGLTPGAPVAYDAEKKEWRPARGDRLRLDIRFDEKGRERTVPAEDWIIDAAKGKPAEPIDWVFAGSTWNKDGEFAADAEGTIVCVVDFGAALIAVGSLHTSDNAELWLSANDKRVPARGTRCTLIIRGREGRPISVEVNREGGMVFDGRLVTVREVASIYQRRAKTGEQPAVSLRAADDVPRKAVQEAMRAIVEAGVPDAAVKVVSDAKPPPRTAQPPDRQEP